MIEIANTRIVCQWLGVSYDKQHTFSKTFFFFSQIHFHDIFAGLAILFSNTLPWYFCKYGYGIPKFKLFYRRNDQSIIQNEFIATTHITGVLCPIYCKTSWPETRKWKAKSSDLNFGNQMKTLGLGNLCTSRVKIGPLGLPSKVSLGIGVRSWIKKSHVTRIHSPQEYHGINARWSLAVFDQNYFSGKTKISK